MCQGVISLRSASEGPRQLLLLYRRRVRVCTHVGGVHLETGLEKKIIDGVGAR